MLATEMYAQLKETRIGYKQVQGMTDGEKRMKPNSVLCQESEFVRGGGEEQGAVNKAYGPPCDALNVTNGLLSPASSPVDCHRSLIHSSEQIGLYKHVSLACLRHFFHLIQCAEFRRSRGEARLESSGRTYPEPCRLNNDSGREGLMDYFNN